MKRFQFRLERVLELRQEEEQRQARIMADARRDAQAARQAVLDMEALRNASRDRLVKAHDVSHTVGQLQNLELVLGRLDTQIAHAHVRADAADAEASRRLEEFKKAVQQRQSLDRLRSRRKEQWAADSRAEEQKVMDELALTRHFRAGDAEGLEGEKAR